MDFEKIQFNKKYLKKINIDEKSTIDNLLRYNFDKFFSVTSHNIKIKIIHEIFILLSVNKWYILHMNYKFSQVVRLKIKEFKTYEDMKDIMEDYNEYIFGDKNILLDYNRFKKSLATFNLKLTNGKKVKEVII